MLNCVTLILLFGKSTEKRGLLHFIFIINLILYIFGTPSFIYPYPRILDVTGVSKGVNSLINTGSLITSGEYSYAYYLNEFPGSAIFFSMICQTLDISVISFANYYPIYLMFIISLLVYTITEKITKRYAFLASAAYLSLTHVQEYNLSPQAHALTLTAVLLLLIIRFFAARHVDNTTIIFNNLLIIILWSSIIISHPATPIYNLISLIFIYFTYLSFKFVNFLSLKKEPCLCLNKISKNIKIIEHFIVLFGIMYIAYLLYYSDFMLDKVILVAKLIMNNILNNDGMYVIDTVLVSYPEISYILLYRLRWMEIIGTALLGVFSIFILFFGIEKKTLTFFVSSLFMGYALISVFFIIFGYGYAATRAYIFLLIPYSVLTSMIWDIKLGFKKDRVVKYFMLFKIMGVLFLISSLLLLPISIYGGDPYNFVSESELARENFTQKHISNSIIVDTYDILQHKISREDIVQFHAYWYNLLQLKQQAGMEYINELESSKFDKFYDNPQSKIYQKR